MSTLSFLTQEFSGEFVPLYDQLLVRELAPEEQIGSIVIPESSRKGPDGDKFLSRGIVVAIGPGDKWESPVRIVDALTNGHSAEYFRHAMYVRPGDTVIFDRPSNRKVNLDGVDYYILHEEQHCLAVIEQ